MKIVSRKLENMLRNIRRQGKLVSMGIRNDSVKLWTIFVKSICRLSSSAKKPSKKKRKLGSRQAMCPRKEHIRPLLRGSPTSRLLFLER
jgi:hypothetical protein